METTKSESKTKMETLESQMTQVTADLATLKENDKNDELSKQLSQIQTDLDQKLSSAETNLEEFRAAFAKFQNETVETQSDTGKKLADVDSQIKSFVSSSQGSVQDVMSDAESLKVFKKKKRKKKFLKITQNVSFEFWHFPPFLAY